jgi:RNA polymerase sigma-70 factor (ECF subfamily)
MANDPHDPGLYWERYRESLHLLARLQFPARLRTKLDASDVIQETLLEAHQAQDRLASFDEPGRAAYLRRILAHNLADLARRYDAEARDVARERPLEARLNESSARIAGWLAADQSSPSQQAARDEKQIALANALAQVPADQGVAVELRYLQGCSVAEIGAVLDLSETAVGGLLRRGLKRLKEQLNPSE